MKKFKKPLSLAICALGLVSLAGCGVTTQDNYIIEYNYVNPDGNVETKQITADDIFERYLEQNPSNHAQAFYDAMYEVQIRLAFVDENGAMHDYLNEVNRTTDNDIIEAQDTAEESDVSWEDYLTDTLGYDDPNMDENEKEHQYWLDRQYENMEDRVDDQYYEVFNTWRQDSTAEDWELQQQYNIVWGDNGYINQRIPYHVKHILVKIGSSEDNYTRSEVTADNVEKLYNVVNALINVNPSEGTTFTSTAKIWSDDTGITSNPNGYIMDTSTSFVNEFKLGVYAYETLLNMEPSDTNPAKTNNASKEAYNNRIASDDSSNKSLFNIPGYNEDGTTKDGSIANYIQDLGASFIPYGALQELYNLRSIETYNGQTVNEGNAAYYPRNIIFNKYFNRHNIAFITDEDVSYANAPEDFNGSMGRTVTYTDGTTGYSDIVDGKYSTSNTTYSGLNTQNFKSITIDGTPKKVLCDENGNPILVTLNATSSGGIHFIVVERSGLIQTQKENRHDEVDPRDVSLAEYFAPVNPLVSNGYTTDENGQRIPDYNVEFPGVDTNNDGEVDGTPKITYVYGDTVTNQEGYESIISSGDSANPLLKEKYENFQSSAGNSTASIKEFVITNWLQDASNTTISVKSNNADVDALIQRYIEHTNLQYNNGVSDTLYDAWLSYFNTINNQERERDNGLIPETCALHFGDSKYYAEGSMCYYSSSANQTGGSDTGTTN